MTRTVLGSYLVALSICLGCGAESSGNKLSGSVERSFNLEFDQVKIERQESNNAWIAMIVTYLNSSTGEIPVKVVANAPIEAGVKHDLVTDGKVDRFVQNGAKFKNPPQAGKAHITFDTLGQVGESASGNFFVTFSDGSTLNGAFSGTVTQLQ